MDLPINSMVIFQFANCKRLLEGIYFSCWWLHGLNFSGSRISGMDENAHSNYSLGHSHEIHLETL